MGLDDAAHRFQLKNDYIFHDNVGNEFAYDFAVLMHADRLLLFNWIHSDLHDLVHPVLLSEMNFTLHTDVMRSDRRERDV